jgi:hypothetical protein
LLRASQAIALNIAEGNGKATDGDRRRYFEIARGSASECAAIQDVLEVCGALCAEENAKAKEVLDRIAAMLTKLGGRGYAVREDRARYGRREGIPIPIAIAIAIPTAIGVEFGSGSVSGSVSLSVSKATI